jgi:hypothetical protein
VRNGQYLNGRAYNIPSAVAFYSLPIDTSYQQSFSITGSSWSNGVMTLTVSGLPSGSAHIMGPFQISGGACSTGNGEAYITNSNASAGTVQYALVSNPGSCAGGSFKFPIIRQFDERVYQTDSGGVSPSPTPSPAPSPTPTPSPSPSPSVTFTSGQRVQTTSNLNVRLTASASGTLLGTQSLGALGTIVSGGTSADGYFWWNVNFDSGVDGYVVENYLTNSSTPIVGDLNSDGLVNSIDLSLLTSKWNQSYPAYDLNSDGIINTLDYAILSSHWSL